MYKVSWMQCFQIMFSIKMWQIRKLREKRFLNPPRYSLAASSGETAYCKQMDMLWDSGLFTAVDSLSNAIRLLGRKESRLQLLRHSENIYSFMSKYHLGKANLMLIPISWHPTWFQILFFYSGVRVNVHTETSPFSDTPECECETVTWDKRWGKRTRLRPHGNPGERWLSLL